MAFANETVVMTEFAQADVSYFQGNKMMLNEVGSTSTPIRMAYLKTFLDIHYVTRWQLRDNSVVYGLEVIFVLGEMSTKKM